MTSSSNDSIVFDFLDKTSPEFSTPMPNIDDMHQLGPAEFMIFYSALAQAFSYMRETYGKSEWAFCCSDEFIKDLESRKCKKVKQKIIKLIEMKFFEKLETGASEQFKINATFLFPEISAADYEENNSKKEKQDRKNLELFQEYKEILKEGIPLKDGFSREIMKMKNICIEDLGVLLCAVSVATNKMIESDGESLWTFYLQDLENNSHEKQVPQKSLTTLQKLNFISVCLDLEGKPKMKMDVSKIFHTKK